MPALSEKHIYDAGLPATNAPFNLCVRHGDLIFISGLPPFDEAFSRAVREAREQGRPVPPFPNPPFAEQVRLVILRIGCAPAHSCRRSRRICANASCRSWWAWASCMPLWCC